MYYYKSKIDPDRSGTYPVEEITADEAVVFAQEVLSTLLSENAALKGRVALLERVAEAAEECGRQYFYADDDDYDDVAYDEAMKRLRSALSAAREGNRG